MSGKNNFINNALYSSELYFKYSDEKTKEKTYRKSDPQFEEIKEEQKGDSSEVKGKKTRVSQPSMDEVFVSGRVQKQKAEMRKMALEK